MGHPNRKMLRQKKREEKKEEGLSRVNNLGKLDLTPHNAVNMMINYKSGTTVILKL